MTKPCDEGVTIATNIKDKQEVHKKSQPTRYFIASPPIVQSHWPPTSTLPCLRPIKFLSTFYCHHSINTVFIK